MGKVFRGKEKLRKIMERDGGSCHYCARSISQDLPADHPCRASLDHVVPRSMGGADAMSNLVAACVACNSRRGNQPAKGQWKAKIQGHTAKQAVA